MKNVMNPGKLYSSIPMSGTEIIFLLILLACLIIRLIFIFVSDINWDEFYYLSQVYDYQRGTLQSAFQTLHVHAFGWLKYVSVNEVSQIIVARLVMFVLGLFTACFLYLICRKFATRTASLFAVMGYCTFSFVGDHAASFRTDPIATFLLMGALFLVVHFRKRIVHLSLAGLLIGLSGLVTIKAIFYIPTIGIILLVGLLQSEKKLRALIAAGAATFVALATFAAIYLLHKFTLGNPLETTNVQMLSNSIDKMIRLDSAFPQWRVIIHSASANITFTLAILFGIVLTVARIFRQQHQNRANQALLLAFALPLFTLVFYQNSFPYYYVFMLAPVSVLLAVAVDNLSAFGVLTEQKQRLLALFLIFLLTQLGVNILKNASRTSKTQRATLEMIHTAFPDPVAYIDRSSMVSSFPKAGFFMSGWGFENYYTDGKAVMREAINKYQPQFLLGNIDALDLEKHNTPAGAYRESRLFDEDRVTLHENFIHHWGIVYVPGKRFVNLKAEAETKFEVLIEGVYTLESAYEVYFDGIIVKPGNKLFFKQGYHTIRAIRVTELAVLRWGDKFYKPSFPAPDAPVFFGF